MTTTDLNLFDAMYSKMNFLGQRQKVIAQNIANSDTPNYNALEIKEPDFKSVLGNTASRRMPLSGGSVGNTGLDVTNAAHMDMNGSKIGGDRGEQKERGARKTYEVSPSNNAVVIEEQLIQAGETMMDHNLMSNIHEKYLNMLRAATGQR